MNTENDQTPAGPEPAPPPPLEAAPALPSVEEETDYLLAKAKGDVDVNELFGAPKPIEEHEDPEDTGLLPKRARARAKRTVDTAPEIADQADLHWYVLHAHSGHENRVRKNIEQRVKQHALDEFVPQVLVPSEEVAEVKGGKKRVSQRKSYPGYVFVQMRLSNDVWMLVKSTPGVTGFLGTKKHPTPLPQAEMDAIFEEMRNDPDKPKPKVMFERNEQVKIVEGPFTNFTGYVDEVNVERGRLKVLVEVFERRTPVECEIWQVEKI